MTTHPHIPFGGAAPALLPMAWQTSPIYVVWDVDGTVRQSSASYATLVGLPADEVLGRPWPTLIEGEEELSWQQLRFTVATLRAAPVVVVDMPTNASGTTTWLRWTEWGVHDSNGDLVQVHSTALDVTELHETRGVLASVLESVVGAGAEGGGVVGGQLHNGAVQHLVAAQWALDDGDLAAARTLLADALRAVRSSMDTLDPPTTLIEGAAGGAQLWKRVPTSGRDDALPPEARLAVSDAVSDAVAVLSSTGAVWLSPSGREALFDEATDVDVVSLLAAAHPDDREGLVAAVLAVLDGEERRAVWRYLHPARGWRHLATWLRPLSLAADGPKLALALSLDVTDPGYGTVDLMGAQLAERERIARDLHDDALQQLAGLRWMLMGRDVDREVIDEVDLVDAAIRAQLAELHSAVARFGLERALSHLVGHVATPVTATWSPDLQLLPPDVAEVLFRSAREALRNVDQHARASRVEVTLVIDEHRAVLTVTDDGVGVEQRQLVAAGLAGHLGVSSMREAVLSMGGRFELAKLDTGGTRVRVDVPLRGTRVPPPGG